LLFNSFIFFVFLGIVLPVFYLLPNRKTKNLFLLISSYIFYGYWDWRFCSLLLFSTLVDFFIGKLLSQQKIELRRRILLLISLSVNLGILGTFKYFNFFIESFQSILPESNSLDFLHLKVLLPVGISFYTFQTLSYTIDIYRKRIKPTESILDFALFVSFFPQLVAGPIERASNLLPQLSKKLEPSKDQIEKGVTLIVSGLFRKVMIGDTAGKYVDHIFGNIQLYTSFELIVSLILFSIQIYADFSGYSHIARGVAKLLGIELMKNFEQPYLSRNITEFWRRWHISLSSWLKDYLYISLGGNRKGNRRTYINLMATMLLGGLWHGASWNFVIWGGLHGVYLAIHKMISKSKIEATRYKFDNRKGLLRFIASVTLNFILVTFSWLFFRSTSWVSTKLFFYKIFHWEKSEHTGQLWIVLLSYIVITLIIDSLEYFSGRHTFILAIKNRMLKFGLLAVLFIISLLYMFQSEPLPFIYFQF
jgi:alginate O-acetyltransferase complex protein AlgI